MGEKIKRTRWTVYNINYHFVWIPKYRQKVLTGKVAEKCKELIEKVAKKNSIEIISLSIQPDYIHLFISAPPRFSPSVLVNLFKGYTSRYLLQEFPELRTPHGLWTRTYYVGTDGTVSEETIKRYIKECQDV